MDKLALLCGLLFYIILGKGKYVVLSLHEVDEIDFVNSIKGMWKYIFSHMNIYEFIQ